MSREDLIQKEIIEHIDKSIEKIGIEATRVKVVDMLNQSLEIKKDLESMNMPLKNIPSHIEMAHDILDYLNVKKSEKRDSIIDSLFENRIMNFDTYSFKVLLDRFIR
jgi:ribonucleotide reductase beta subunit family protein with ferritin-like domain